MGRKQLSNYINEFGLYANSGLHKTREKACRIEYAYFCSFFD